MDKLIITAAVTGSLTTRDQNPNIPYTPQEIAEAAVEACEAGAAVIHLHMREPATGRPVHDARLFGETIRLIRQKCDPVINTTTGGAPGMTAEERIAIVPALAADPEVKQEMASFTMGSVNFGIFSKKRRIFVLDAVNLNPWSQLLHYADTMREHGVKPEIEIFDAGMVSNAMYLHEVGALEAPLHFQLVLGVLGAMRATVENLVFLKNTLPPGSTWSLCVVGLDIFWLGAVAIATGGHVRVGLEDCVHISKGVLADNSAQMVERIARLASDMGRPIATPDEARSILGV
jgi:3-keto-5-aminohexanoate cleavage enzyme